MDIEEDIKILEEMIKNANIENMDMNDCFGGEHIEAIEHILSDYKKLQEEFKQVDHECDRLEQKEFKLEIENQELKQDISHMYNEEVVISIMCDEFNISRSEALELLGEE